MAAIESTPDFVNAVYTRTRARLEKVRARLGRPLTLTEKILFGHLDDPDRAAARARQGVPRAAARPRGHAGRDGADGAAAVHARRDGRRVAVPTTVHCDHLILARVGAAADVVRAVETNHEVYDFLESVSARYGIGFWKPGAGIIHQVVLENYAFPGGMMIGTDSHTPNAGGLGMFAIGVGGADAVDVMAGLPWEVLQPEAHRRAA